jgi:prevent-host-death family protein
MKTVNLHAAKTHLSRLVEQAVDGEDIVIAKAGKPLVRLVPVDTRPQRRRGFGMLKGRLRIIKDFDAPLPDDIARAFGMVVPKRKRR